MSPEPHGIVRALLRLQEEEGWLPPDRLEALATELGVPLHRIESVSTFYTHFRRERPVGPIVEVCRDLSCRLAGGEAACERLRSRAAGGEGAPAFEVHEVSCLGRCDAAPAAALGDHVLDVTDQDAVLTAVAADASEAVPRPVRSWPEADPYAAGELASFGVLRSVVEAGSKTDPIERLDGAGLRGMGGAGFPTGRKWSLVAAETAHEKIVVCNADESEPGTFKDRELLHDVPHLVLEGMAIAAYCVGASRGIVFIRHEYGAERLRLEAALEAARAAGGLGRDLFGSGFDFDVEIFVSPGGYILGEETALLECMEDRRGEPRNKPPFPGNAGLDGLPTLINNVETLVHVVSIVYRGVDWWHGLGVGDFAGHKFLSVSGDVAAPGVSLFPVGVSLGDVLEAHGGVKDGATLAAVAPGGASSNFLGPEALTLALDFDALAAAGTMLGSGAAVFVDGSRDLLDVGRSITRFFRNESCGKCVPCRVGSEKAVALLSKGEGVSAEDEALVRSLHETMQQTSICGLGQVALGPLLSILDRFPEVARATDGD
ncbi:MAG: NAD(P)H-dependent oxidoreductase subunit E [bacterium]|nr:NAD(P)H-dependent oxidoreductase subunit E [bacterium]